MVKNKGFLGHFSVMYLTFLPSKQNHTYSNKIRIYTVLNERMAIVRLIVLKI